MPQALLLCHSGLSVIYSPKKPGRKALHFTVREETSQGRLCGLPEGSEAGCRASGSPNKPVLSLSGGAPGIPTSSARKHQVACQVGSTSRGTAGLLSLWTGLWPSRSQRPGSRGAGSLCGGPWGPAGTGCSGHGCPPIGSECKSGRRQWWLTHYRSSKPFYVTGHTL